MRRIGFSLLAATLGITMVATCHAEEQQELLILGEDCKQKSWTTRIRMSLMNKSELKQFWIGQQYAVERERQEYLADRRSEAADRQADKQIEALERRKDEIEEKRNAAYGLPPDPEVKKWMREDAKEHAAWQRENAAEDREYNKGMLEWYRRCKAYAEQQVRQLE